MFFTSEDDEGDFLSPGGSKLASVFGMDRASSQGGNESLTYTAPKQPKKKEAGGGGGEGAAAAAATGVSAATVVHAYKLVDSQYASQGKVGAAILVNHAAHEYRILLYVTKQQQLTNVKITPGFAFNVQANNYANFYDEGRVNWSIMFTSTQDAVKFTKEVGLFKALASGGQPTSLVQQDLQLGEGGALESGDSVEAKYTGWLLSNNTFGQVFDSNASSDKLFRFKVGKGKVIKGWDQGMLGMRKGGKRILVIPPSLAYGSQGVPDRIPANATLIFEVEVVRVKLQKGEATAEPSQPPAPVAAPVPVPSEVMEVDHGDDTVKERSRSITEQLSTQSPKSDKAKLISRMAKMGQPMLPNMSGAVPAQPDSEEEPPSPQPSTVKPQLPSKPHPAHPLHPAHPPVAQPMAQQPVQMAGQPVAAQPQPYAQPMAQPVNPAMAAMGMQNIHPDPSQPPTFLQNLPAAQQLSVYQPQPTLLQQQQQAMLAMQQQQQQQQMGGVPMAQPTPLSDAMAPLLLSETRQQNTEMRMAVSKMADKVDRILDKVENFNSQGHQQSLPAPTMETSILLHNISRIVQENERLKKEVFERGEKIETQNEKIAELLQKNQRYVEKSNTLLEERNEGYKLTANQSQSRILALEQEKVHLATELSTSTAQLATLQLELGELRKREGELRQQLQSSSSTTASHQDELEKLRLQRAEDEKKLTDLTASLREEKTARKQSDGQLTAVQEELADLRSTCSTLERNLNERKRKAAEERKKQEEEIEEVKAGYEEEIKTIRDKLRRQRTNTDVETADRVAKLEEELTAEWQAKCDKMVAAAADKHARQMALVKDDLQEAQDRAAKLEAKLQEMRNSSNSSDARLADLQQQVEENAAFKDKYESLRNQATAMKQRYEERIVELEEEGETKAAKQQQLMQQLQQTRQQLQQQEQKQQQSAAASGASTSADVATEVKKVMNSVYQSLRGEFDKDENYTGGEIMSVVLGVIKETTLKLVQQSQASAAQEEEEESEEEEEEEDEEEEEEEDKEDGEEEEEEEEEEVTSTETDSAPVSSKDAASEQTTATTSPPQAEQKPSDTQQSASPAQLPLVPDDSDCEDDFDDADEEPDVKARQEAQPAEVTPSPMEPTASPAEAMPSAEATPSPAEVPPTPPVGVAEEEAAQSVKPLSEPAPDVPPNTSQTSSTEERGQGQEVQKPDKPKLDKPPEIPPLLTAEEMKGATDSGSVKAERSSSSVSGSNLPTLASREPPPLFDDDDDDSPLFGSDDHVADTFGSAALPAATEPEKKDKKGGDKLPTKNDLLGEDDMKPKPPPPLFGDDDDDEDLDWLS